MSRRQGPPSAGSTLEDLNLKLAPEIERMADEIVKWRRNFHSQPELGFKEKHTGAIGMVLYNYCYPL